LKTILLELQYLPNIAYFSALMKAETIIIEQHEYFEKQSFRNRAVIRGPHQSETLSVPVLNSNSKQLIQDVRIDNSQNWQKIHWRTITAAYAKSPYFEFFADYFLPIYDRKNDNLWNLNLELLTICLKLAKASPTIQFSENYIKLLPDDVLDLRSAIHPKKNIDSLSFFCPFVYSQNFGNDFVENLSIIDLLFCKGTDAKMILQKSLII
jgi:hypothetical protein